MLFNSYEFLFLFLPITLLVYFRLARASRDSAILWLVLASLVFYAWWNAVYLLLIIASMLGNFGIGNLLSQARREHRHHAGRLWLMAGVGANLAVLGYFKYANFAVDSLNAIAGTDFHLQAIVLPLAISFFTFQQIAYLVDAYNGITREYRFAHYAPFVTFFPQLIAGPIVHHKDMLPQFMRESALAPNMQNIAVGVTIFLIGLFKKVVLADGVAQYGTPVFNAAANGATLTLLEAWGGALAYTFQLYFDFSGYSDMAVGAARMFGITLAVNFHSPYKATSIVEFWRRWHITLSTFLRDYLYIALGGNRAGKVMRYRNLLLTMLLGGLWHGAGWTFVVWGALHGLYLCINHAWTHFTNRFVPRQLLPRPIAKALAWSLTFIAVVVGWVFFRSASFEAAGAMLKGMAGLNGIALPADVAAQAGALWDLLSGLGVGTYADQGDRFIFTWLWIASLLPVALALPNTQQILRNFDPGQHIPTSRDEHEIRPLQALTRRICWAPSTPWAIFAALLATLSILSLTRLSEFLYFQF